MSTEERGHCGLKCRIPNYLLILFTLVCLFSEKGLDEYSSGYCTTKRRPHTAQPALQSSQHHLHWGGDYTLSGRGTLPRHATRPWIPPPPSGMPASPTPKPYPWIPRNHTTSTPTTILCPNQEKLSPVISCSTWVTSLVTQGLCPGCPRNQQHQYYKAMVASNKNSNTQTLTRKAQTGRRDRRDRSGRRDRRDKTGMLMSPDHLDGEDGAYGVWWIRMPTE